MCSVTFDIGLCGALRASRSSELAQRYCVHVLGRRRAVTSEEVGTRPRMSVKKPPISVHILDVTKGVAVGKVSVSLEKLENGEWKWINASETNLDGRCEDLIESASPYLTVGRFKIRFNVEKYFLSTKTAALYPYIDVVFDMKNSQESHHLPLLLSPFGYSTYRGS